MKKIISILQPFDLKQTIIAYEDGNKIAAAQVETASIASEICKMAKAENIKEIHLGGAKKYARGIGKKIEEAAATEYSLENLKIEFL